MEHTITVSTNASGWIFLTCSCQQDGHAGPDELAASRGSVTLTALNELAHEHIEAAEAENPVRLVERRQAKWAASPVCMIPGCGCTGEAHA